MKRRFMPPCGVLTYARVLIPPSAGLRAPLHVTPCLAARCLLHQPVAAATALELPRAYYEKLRDDYTRKRDLFLGYLDEAGLAYTTPQGPMM